MKRRNLIGYIAAGTLLGGLPFALRAQNNRERPLVVYFASATQAAASRYYGFLLEGLRDTGDREGLEFDFTGRFADFDVDRLPRLANDLVALKPTVIVCGAVDTATVARKATRTIPIVSAALADAIDLGLVESYPHPGGNVTGITPYVEGLPAKQLELARELVPGARTVGLLGNLNDPKALPQREELEIAGRASGIRILSPFIAGPGDIETAIKELAGHRVDLVIVLQTTMMLGQRKRIAAAMAANRLPAVYGYREHVDDGGLISYGVDLRWCWHRLATFVHKILKGASPADLPVEFPSRLQLVVNMKTAKALRITIPPLVLVRADEVIES